VDSSLPPLRRLTLGNWLGTGLPKLTALRVRKAKPGVYADGDGLYLCVSSSMSHTWVFRFNPGTVAVPEMGLGSSDSKTELAEAREARVEARRLLRFGRNPIDVRKQDRRLSAKIQGKAQCETPRSMALEPHRGCGGPKVPAG
jgi:Arm DNA-binding domain